MVAAYKDAERRWTVEKGLQKGKTTDCQAAVIEYNLKREMAEFRLRSQECHRVNNFPDTGNHPQAIRDAIAAMDKAWLKMIDACQDEWDEWNEYIAKLDAYYFDITTNRYPQYTCNDDSTAPSAGEQYDNPWLLSSVSDY